ncbi:TnsA-like heteromeric transposase endonuclease subunit [Mycolicibacterium austroafricanum]|uniref:TnsA-like heteromeric transposase endonuclease subunit n=1 Tax=Mycolicibacterium austroafricanum TaxID=39687 RepID=A0ABT8H8T9_MYCAO|nr:TnsA-like heteromeric transposase endonuclease subunit [Mycolicibacterium austroafricanum]MDN4517184.1 TnsA-like heteromeric transposase endonuclease subunit [Mycolicibacterium austroafricanum]
MTETAVVLVRLPGAGVASWPADSPLAGIPVETAEPIRQFYSWPGKRNYDGRWWSSTSGRHVVFESLLERDALMMADFSTEVVAVCAQPLAFLWPRGTAHAAHHVPDFFVRLSCGDGRVVDVKHVDAVAGARLQIALTAAACAEVGWQYEIFTGSDCAPALDRNVRWLSGYRHDRYRPQRSVLRAIDEAFGCPTPLREGASRAAAGCASSVGTVLGHVYHCVWTHHLRADLSVPLTMTTTVSR